MSEYKLLRNNGVKRMSDGASFGTSDPANTDYAAYLEWVAAGGVPDPIDPPDPKQIILDQIVALESTITSRRIREATLTDAGKLWLSNIDSEIELLRSNL